MCLGLGASMRQNWDSSQVFLMLEPTVFSKWAAFIKTLDYWDLLILLKLYYYLSVPHSIRVRSIIQWEILLRGLGRTDVKEEDYYWLVWILKAAAPGSHPRDYGCFRLGTGAQHRAWHPGTPQWIGFRITYIPEPWKKHSLERGQVIRNRWHYYLKGVIGKCHIFRYYLFSL